MAARGTRRLGATAVLAVAAAALTGGPAGSAVKPTVRAADNASLGTILVSAAGRTLYHYADDHGAVVACTGACAALWPPVTIPARAKPVAGPGIRASRLGTVKRPDGRVQVTYNGFALYRFSGDARRGQVNGQGLKKEWYALAPSGRLVKRLPAAPPSGAAAGSSGSSVTPSSADSSSADSGSSSADDTYGGGYGY